ncbi:MAG: biotin--[Clostridia bacterium]|nr:biotin--[acetyl-CoA-carboxylase] ligase [Clostridia bacterium]
MKTIYFDKIGSTNDYLKKIKNPQEDIFVIAKTQDGGRGTKGRSFICREGGVYASLLKLYPCKAEESFSIMMCSALAVVKTLSAFDVKAKIKWPNDIIVNDKKICGILIENVFEGDDVARCVIGVGLNVNNTLDDEIKNIAISTKQVLNKELDVNTVSATLCYNLYLEPDYEEYKKHLLYIGEEVTIIEQKSTYKAFIDDVLPDGRLKLKNGKLFSSAEITLRQS